MPDFSAPMSFSRRQALLRENFPGWEIWYVPRAEGGTLWLARRQGEPNLANTLQSTRPSELADLIRQAQASGAFQEPASLRTDRLER